MSWHEDSLTVAQDAMMNSWDEVTYLFPPVPLLLRVLQKLRREAISAIVVCPHCPSAIWWPLLQELLVQPPFQLPHYRSALLPSQQPSALPGPPDSCPRQVSSHSLRDEAELDKGDLEFLSHHLAVGTRKGYSGAFAKFSAFCKFF